MRAGGGHAGRVTSAMVAVDGGELWADDSGGDGPPLVLLHPGVGDSRFWELVLPALTAAYRVIRYDDRGFGRSPAPTGKFSLYDDLIAVLGHYRLDRVAVAGCSQGGATGLALAHEDSALKAYFQTRDRYLHGLPQHRAFNQIGEARPCIIIDGVVAGTWAWNARMASIDTDLITGRCPPRPGARPRSGPRS
jgi:pimeloyl-ACP methyl ester carboxylesterase